MNYYLQQKIDGRCLLLLTRRRKAAGRRWVGALPWYLGDQTGNLTPAKRPSATAGTAIGSPLAETHGADGCGGRRGCIWQDWVMWPPVPVMPQENPGDAI